MRRLFPPGLPQSKILSLAVCLLCLLVCVWVTAPVARAQRVASRAGAGARVSAPRVSAPPVMRMAVPRVRISVGRVGIGLGPIYPFGRPFFYGRPFFRYRAAFAFNAEWWPAFCPFWGWGFGCTDLPNYGAIYGPVFPSYVAPQIYEYPAYLYGHEAPEMVQLFLKDGTVIDVMDYWFVDQQIHFTVPEEGEKPEEQVIGLDELDLQRTIDVNTRRGFRFVMRNEPWEQYLRDHPNDTPKPVTPPQKP
jgi:hypothetical protein